MLFLTLQDNLSHRITSDELDAHGIRQWVYLGEDSAWRVRAEESIGPDVPRISTANLLDQTAWKLRQPYIDWIGQLSTTNDSLEWWASGLAEKNPFSRLYVRICLLSCSMQLIREGLTGDTLMVCSTPALLAQVLRFASDPGTPTRVITLPTGFPGLSRAVRASRRYLRAPYRRFKNLSDRFLNRVPASLHADPVFRRSVLARLGVHPGGDFSGDDSILVFTWVDGRNFSRTGGYQDPHLGLLPDMLRRKGYRIAYVPRVLNSIPFEEAVERLLGTGERLFFPELFVTPEDIEACQRRAKGFQVKIPCDSQVGDMPVYDLALEQVEQDRRRLAETLAYEPLVTNLSAAGVVPWQIIHTCEGQRWEHVLAWAVRRHMTGTRVVGYDTGTFSRMHLPMYPAVCERGIRPLPDQIVTNGPLARNALSADGPRPEIVDRGCAMRFPQLAAQTSRSTSSSRLPDNGRLTIAVATSLDFGDSIELVAKAAHAFGGQADTDVLVKCHPMVDARRLAGSMGKLGRLPNLRFVECSITELLSEVQVVLYRWTTVCFDALRQGVVPVFVQSENGLNLDKLEGVPEVRRVAASPEELRRVVAEIVGMTLEERQTWQERAEEALRMAFAPITPECVDAFIV